MRAHGDPEAHPVDNTYSTPLAIGIFFGWGGPCHSYLYIFWMGGPCYKVWGGEVLAFNRRLG